MANYDPEHHFEDELQCFRHEIDIGTQALYVMLIILSKASKDKLFINHITRTPYFWNTILNSLLTTQFIALGRIFDDNSPHNLHQLLKFTKRNPDIFTRSALFARRKGTGNPGIDWKEYANKAYEPIPKDFRRLRAHVKRYRAEYEVLYKDIRNKIFAHREILPTHADLFKHLEIRRLKLLFVFLAKLHDALCGLYHNGHEPRLKQQSYSLEKLLRKKGQRGNPTTIQELVVQDSIIFFQDLLSISRGSVTK
ncbi:hypothetical protein LLG95_08370 [bacterium]|nr:hypothetical protein [bacterium]